jgi:hypothetical protein
MRSGLGQNKKNSQRVFVFRSCRDSAHVSRRPRGNDRRKKRHARREIDLAAVLSDWPIMQALTCAADRGVKVRIYLNGTQPAERAPTKRADAPQQLPNRRAIAAYRRRELFSIQPQSGRAMI